MSRRQKSWEALRSAERFVGFGIAMEHLEYLAAGLNRPALQDLALQDISRWLISREATETD